MSDVVIKSELDNSIGAMWGRMVFFTCVASCVMHVLAGLVTCWSLFLKRPRFVMLVALSQFAVGAVYGFISSCILSFAIALVLFTVNESQLGNSEMGAFIAIMSAFIFFVAIGRTPLLYAL